MTIDTLNNLHKQVSQARSIALGLALAIDCEAGQPSAAVMQGMLSTIVDLLDTISANTPLLEKSSTM